MSAIYEFENKTPRAVISQNLMVLQRAMKTICDRGIMIREIMPAAPISLRKAKRQIPVQDSGLASDQTFLFLARPNLDTPASSIAGLSQSTVVSLVSLSSFSGDESPEVDGLMPEPFYNPEPDRDCLLNLSESFGLGGG